MEKKEFITCINNKKIKSINFKFPELMAEDAKEKIMYDYTSLLDHKNTLQELRIKVREMEAIVKKLEEEFNQKSEMFTLEYDTYTKEYKTTESNILHNGDLVYHYN